jgi:hypothetical protein
MRMVHDIARRRKRAGVCAGGIDPGSIRSLGGSIRLAHLPRPRFASRSASLDQCKIVSSRTRAHFTQLDIRGRALLLASAPRSRRTTHNVIDSREDSIAPFIHTHTIRYHSRVSLRCDLGIGALSSALTPLLGRSSPLSSPLLARRHVVVVPLVTAPFPRHVRAGARRRCIRMVRRMEVGAVAVHHLPSVAAGRGRGETRDTGRSVCSAEEMRVLMSLFALCMCIPLRSSRALRARRGDPRVTISARITGGDAEEEEAASSEHVRTTA